MTQSPDPYDILGVPKDADGAAIRKAYRKAAKGAHPDAGGSDKSFALVKLAHDVLIDPKRRAKFDATGSIDESEPDNALADVLNLLMGAMDQAIRACEQEHMKPEQSDLVQRMKRAIAAGITERGQKRQMLRDAEVKVKRLLGRFKTKKSAVNFLEDMLVRSLGGVGQQIQQLERFDIAAKTALEMLNDYTFKSDPLPTQEGGGIRYEQELAKFSRYFGGG